MKYNPYRFLKDYSNPTQTQWVGYKSTGATKLLYPNELLADFAFLPFGGGIRKCVGDQFAMMEATAALTLIMQRFDVSLAIPAKDVGMRTGATIHTENGLMMTAKHRTNVVIPVTLDKIGLRSHMVVTHDGSSSEGGGCPMHSTGSTTDMVAAATTAIVESSSVGSSSEEAKCPFN